MNKNYDQVAELYAQGLLSWERDGIVAILYTDLVFDQTQTKVVDLVGTQKATQPITGRWFKDGFAMGLPVAFSNVGAGLEFQVVVSQNMGGNDLNLLAYFDSNANDTPITLQRSGTLIVRPIQPDLTIPPERPPTIGVWMRLPA